MENNLEGGVKETPEDLVNFYITRYGYSSDKVEKEIRYRWEMDDADKAKALKHLVKTYGIVLKMKSKTI